MTRCGRARRDARRHHPVPPYGMMTACAVIGSGFSCRSDFVVQTFVKNWAVQVSPAFAAVT